ncbi:MAG: hypothetical protein ACFFG0_33900, partial [Candidatus Thorarchaeota archaeon]
MESFKRRIQSAFTLNVLRRSLLYFLPLTVIFGIIFSISCYYVIEEQQEIIRLKARYIVKNRVEVFALEFDVITSDLLFLTDLR